MNDEIRQIDPDAQLVSQAVLGDEAAFGNLMERHQRLLTALAFGMTHDEAKSEDIVQEAFVSAWRALPKFRGDSNFKNWMCRITLNKARSALRWSRLRRWVRLDAPLSETQQSWIDSIQDTGTDADPEGVAIRSEMDGAIRRAIAELPLQQRTAILLRANGMSVKEVAAAMDIAEGTVKAHLHQARQNLGPLV